MTQPTASWLPAGEPPLYAHLTPDFCFSHWSTQCRAAFGAPIDPHLVLGGFPIDSTQFKNYTADTTAFVVTFPLDSHPDKRWGPACALSYGRGRVVRLL